MAVEWKVDVMEVNKMKDWCILAKYVGRVKLLMENVLFVLSGINGMVMLVE